MDLPPSGRSRGRSDSPSLAADLLSMLDVDDGEDGDTLSAFTLIPAPSTVSSLGPSVQTRRAALAAATAASSGASVFPLSATPVRLGGSRASRSRGGGSAGGVGTRISPMSSKVRSPRTASPADKINPSSPLFQSKKAGDAQFCVFIDTDSLESLCLGRVGTSNRFCLAARNFPYSHCGIPAHGKGSNGRKKFIPTARTYYAPGGVATNRPTAKMTPCIKLDDVPSYLLLKFEKGEESGDEWEKIIEKALKYDEDEDIKGDDDEDTTDESEDNSTIMSGMDEGYYEDVEIKFDWDSELSEYEGNEAWAPTARAHRAALELLAQALTTTSKTVGRDMKKLETLLQRNVPSRPEDDKARAALQHLVETHGSLAEAVCAAMESGGIVTLDLEELREGMDDFSADLKKYSDAAEVSSATILQIIARIRERANVRHVEIKERVTRLEHGIAQIQRPNTPPQTSSVGATAVQVLANSSAIDGDKPLGVAQIGGNDTVITANYLFGLIRDLQSKVEILTERSKNTGVIFSAFVLLLRS